MKKETKVTIPTIYAELQNNQKELSKQTIIIDKNGGIFRFTPGHAHGIITDAIAYKFNDFAEFNDKIGPKEIVEWHTNYFNKATPAILDKEKKPDFTMTSLYVWLRLCQLSKDRTEKPKDPITGSITKHAGRIYYRALDHQGTPVICTVKTPQAITCLAIFEATAKTDTINGKTVISCTEANLKAAIYLRATELKTKQDAWRIFQYYRPQLIAAGVIRHN